MTAEIRALAESLTDLVGFCSAVRDESARIVNFRLDYVNAAARAANGATCGGQLGLCLFQLVLARHENGLFESCREVVETGRPYVRDRLPVDDVGADQPVRRWFDVRISKLGDGFVATGRDVTEAHLREEASERSGQELRAGKHQVEEANRAKDRFLALLSHELRSPLSPILLAAAALEADGRLPADARQRAAAIRHHAVVEARLIDDLLDRARIEHGKLELDRRLVDLRQIVEEAVQTCADEAAAKGIRLEADLVPAAGQLLAADPLRLRQALWNLLANALKFTPPGGAVWVTARREGEWLVVEVADTGIGIEASRLPHVFAAFEQGSAETTRRYGGLGLGLAISKGMVEAHGGSLSAASDGPGRGATFTVRLPAAAGASDLS